MCYRLHSLINYGNDDQNDHNNSHYQPHVWSCYWHCCRNLIEKIHLENQLEGALIVNEMNDVLWNALTDHYVQKWRDSVWEMRGCWALRVGSYSIGNLKPPLSFSPMLEPIFLLLPKGC